MTASGRRSGPFRTPTRFLIVALLFHLIDGIVVRSSLFAANPDAIATVVGIDLTFGLTAAWWIMVVRSGNAPLRSLVPVFVTSILAAAATLPAGHRSLLADFRVLAVPFELVLMAGVAIAVRRASRALAAAGAELDVPERIRATLSGAVPSRVAAIVATEFAIFYYALVAWRRKPFVATGTQGFSYHRKNGYAALLFTVVGLAVVELFVADILLRSRYPHVANAMLALDLFGIVWLVGVVRAIQLRPILVSAEMISVRIGLQWTIDMPRECIESVVFGRVKIAVRGTPEWIRGLPSPNALVTLREPLLAEGPYGISKPVRFVALSLDDVSAFQASLRQR